MRYFKNFFGTRVLAMSVFVFTLISSRGVHAALTITPWVPLFKGIDQAGGTNSPNATYPDLMVVHALRVDLTDPDIQLFTTPKANNGLETAGETVTSFLRDYRLQVAVNANLFDPSEYYLPAGTAMEVYGLAISKGTLVSAQEDSTHDAAVIFDTNNVPTIIPNNWPPTSNAGIYNAVSGDYAVVVNGVNIGFQYRNNGLQIHQVNPRTAFGVSQDKRYLYVVTIDGRQPGYSDGALDFETAAWLLLVGAYNGVDMDGGGSTTLVVQDSTGQPKRLNKPSAVAADSQGRERTVGSHFGIFAKPPIGFINDVVATPDDKTAAITWTTTAPATTQVRYGISTNLDTSSPLLSDLTTNHSMALSGLTPKTSYYFQVISSAGGIDHLGPLSLFVTTNYVSTNTVFDVTNPWKFSTANLDGVNWTATNYDDSGWSGPGPGLLWVDIRPAGSQDAAVAPKNTAMPADPANSGYPFTTYYFRTHFTIASVPSGTTLAMSAYVDDGAVFYLNGVEIYRLRMPTDINHSALANGYPGTGDATVSDDFEISADLASHLVAGDNVLAAETHNYNTRSPDITFGLAVAEVVPQAQTAQLQVSYSADGVTLLWNASGFTLQQSSALGGTWTDVPGPVLIGPYKTPAVGQVQFYRLRR